jgi:inorganic phosphate transporter, PiT family
MSGLKVAQNKQAGTDDKHKAGQIHQKLGSAVEYAPWWVRIVSTLTLGLGTMFGYKRIVHTLGDRGLATKPSTAFYANRQRAFCLVRDD